MIFEKSHRSCNPRGTQTHNGRLRGPLLLDDIHTDAQRGTKIPTQTLKVQKAGILTDVTVPPPPRTMDTFTMGSVK